MTCFVALGPSQNRCLEAAGNRLNDKRVGGTFDNGIHFVVFSLVVKKEPVLFAYSVFSWQLWIGIGIYYAD